MKKPDIILGKARLCLMTCSAGTQQGTCNRAEVLNRAQGLYTLQERYKILNQILYYLKIGGVIIVQFQCQSYHDRKLIELSEMYRIYCKRP